MISLIHQHWKRKQRLKKRHKQALQVSNTSKSRFIVRKSDGLCAIYHLVGRQAVPLLHLLHSGYVLALFLLISVACLAQQTALNLDPRPTIYSGQVSFGLLLSAHSSLGAELSTSASHQVNSILMLEDPVVLRNFTGSNEATDDEQSMESTIRSIVNRSHSLGRRQIFERPTHQNQHQQHQHQYKRHQIVNGKSSSAGEPPVCSQVNANALYAGMGAIWASHQANLVGDSHLAIGTYVYDSCNDLEVGQRQSVRIVSNLNAFQQTTCESPRGSPISLTIAHGDNQLKAIQLLTSFRVPVVSTKEHFALEDYSQLSREQRRFLFSTAHSSRHLAVGALRFSKRIVSRSTSSAKLANQYYKMSSKNGLIVISRNLPDRFITYISEVIPNHVNYEMLQSNQPIDQIRSVEALEAVLVKNKQSSESRLSEVTLPSPRVRRSDSYSDGDSSDEPSGDSEHSSMLSPTILLFITPSEAIDLVTRLRNDLADVSRYYSLIVATREDITPALKTIFHRGGSRLCSGKAFYTISPRPDDIGEFSRYFRDTVQMEGETSDHPLICEFAKFQSDTKINADLDDISTEPVIKAVWSAAAAFKSVHRRECASHVYKSTSSGPASTTSQSTGESDTEPSSGEGRRQLNTRQTNKSAHAECMVKMNKNMSNLVQRALKRLDVTINSTGLLSLDGFRLKFDELNELMTNKFSIKHINKECEITEIGQFSGFKDSSLRLDEDALIKSLESTLPDPWPVSAPPAKPEVNPSTTEPPSGASESSKGDTSRSNEERSKQAASSNRARRRQKGPSSESTPVDESSSKNEEEDSTTEAERSNDGDGQQPKRTSKRSRTDESSTRMLKNRLESKGKHYIASPVTAMGGRGILPGLTDTELIDDKTPLVTTQPILDNGEDSLSTKPMRKLKPFPVATGTTLNEWLPSLEPTKIQPTSSSGEPSNNKMTKNHQDVSQMVDLGTRGTTQAPVFSTLPESDGAADLELPSKSIRVAKSTPVSSKTMDAAATTESSDYVTAPSIMRNSINQVRDTSGLLLQPFNYGRHSVMLESENPINQTSNLRDTTGASRVYLKDLSSTPIPLSPSTTSASYQWPENLRLADATDQNHINSDLKNGRSKLRSHLKWIYSSWYALSLLGANICGALLTLYVLTFLLMKNCNGSIERDNQGIRSIHLLAIIVVFFGSTLYIVYPTPGLCLLRTSWHNFALVMLFGSLVLQSMQIRSISSIGLGGRPNRLNQLLTLVFIVGVQVTFEIQRWKYESANYFNFVNQYFGSSEGDYKKLMVLSGAITSQFNPLNAFNDQVSPVSIPVSEQYQNLLQDYCVQKTDDFLQSQIYLCFLVALLVLMSASIRRGRRLKAGSKNTHHQIATTITSGKQVAHQHEANLDLSPSHFQFAPNSYSVSFDAANQLMVIFITAPIYCLSLVLHIYGQNILNRDLISSITLVVIAFVTLVGIFLPILLQGNRYDGLITDHLPNTIAGRVVSQPKSSHDGGSNAFVMFPEFAPTGLRRPISLGGESSSGAGSRRPFADTKESRRNMSVVLANLGSSTESPENTDFDCIDPARKQPLDIEADYNHSANEQQNQSPADIVYGSNQRQARTSSATQKKKSKRLIMLDVDPCCPRHGHAWQHSDPSNGCEIRTTHHSHQWDM